MSEFIAKPHRLFNQIQNYEWGSKNEEAFIPRFLGFEPEPDKPYAELWIGTHPKSPSLIEIDGGKIPLDKIIERHQAEILGEYVNTKFNGKFPFLLKVLSAAEALSIQLHPDKSQAVKLHAKDPLNYPDENHKPEIAVAIDSLTAIAGFKPAGQIKQSISGLQELNELFKNNVVREIVDCTDEDESKQKIKRLYADLMKKADDTAFSDCVNGIVSRLKAKSELNMEEFQFLKQFELYGTDVGLFSFFFFNILSLKSGEAIFTDAGVPHAYIKGNIIECMANSDNVVRAGLTPKYRDVETLLEIVKYDFKQFEIINRDSEHGNVYKTTAEEFELSAFCSNEFKVTDCKTDNKPAVILILEGKIVFEWGNNSELLSEKFIAGSTVLVPASLSGVKLQIFPDTKYFFVTVP